MSYSTKLQSSLAWWKQPLNFASKKVLRYIEHRVKVEFKKAFPWRRKLRHRSSSTRTTSILQFKICSRADELGRIKTWHLEASSSSPDQELILPRSRASSASYTPSGASTRQRSSTKRLTRIFACSSRSSSPKISYSVWLDVESTYFHVPIHPKHRKFFSSHLELPLFVNNKFIELQPGGYYVCTRPDLGPLVPSAQTPSHLRHLYHQVVEISHATLRSVGPARPEYGQRPCFMSTTS